MKLRCSLLLTLLLLSSCDHHKQASQAQAEAGNASVAQGDSDLTGLPAQAQPTKPIATATTKPSVPVQAQTASVPSAAPVVSTPVLTPPVESTPGPPPVDQAPPPVTEHAVPTRASNSVTIQPLPAPTPTETASNIATSNSVDGVPIADQVVVLTTSFGKIVIELDNSAAPITCENFRNLVADGFYNHTVFHRVIPDFIIQGGDPNSLSSDRSKYGLGGPNYKLPAEIKLTHDIGAVAMARLPDSVNPRRQSNGSQFYICLAACPSLDAKYTVFGHVIKGMDVAEKISNQPRDPRDNPLDRIDMEAALEAKSKALANDTNASQ